MGQTFDGERATVVRLRDIADALGVSVATVSLAVNHKDSGRVNPEMAALIRDTARSMNYRPNINAVGLKLSKTHTVALLTQIGTDDPFLAPMTLGAQEAAWKRGYNLITVPEYGPQDSEEAVIESVLRWGVDGIVLSADYYRERVLPDLPGLPPLVFLDCTSATPAPAVTEVIADEVQGAYDATAHLIGAGHRDIGYVGIDDVTYSARHLREKGFRDAIRDLLGVHVEPRIFNAADPSIKAGEAVAEQLFSSGDGPRALFCFSDRTAFGVTRAAQARGLRVPTDLSIVGFDNVQYTSEFFSPPLTTVELPHQQMGSTAVLHLIDQIENGMSAPARISVPCPLIERNSVNSLPIERNDQ